LESILGKKVQIITPPPCQIPDVKFVFHRPLLFA
jgi:hypothetical protein